MAKNYYLKSLFYFLKSKQLALVTIFLLTVLSVLGMIVSQDSADVALRRVFASWWFIVTAFVFLLNLFLCTVAQLRLSVVRRAGLHTWGKTVFHVGLVLVAVGGFVSTGFKMTGYFMVAEGEIRPEVHTNYREIEEGPLFSEKMHQGFAVTLLKQSPVYDRQGRVNYIRSKVAIIEEGKTVAAHWVEKGAPLIYKNYRFFYYLAGFAPMVTIRDSNGKIIYQTFLLLNTYQEGEKPAAYSVTGQPLYETPFTVDLQFFPDARQKNGNLTGGSDRLLNPVAYITVYDRTKKKLAEGIISDKQGVLLPGKQTIALGSEVRRWVGLEVVNDPGARILFAGFWVSLFGLIMFFLKGLQLRIKEA